MGIGIFTSYTGAKSFDSLLQHAFIVDLITDEETWLEASDLCPESSKYPSVDPDYIADKSLDAEISLTISKTSRALADYVGNYGNFGYGNLTVEIMEDSLVFYYGNLGFFQLVATEIEDYFLALGRNTISVIREIDYIQFFSSDGSIVDKLEVGRPEKPLFIRDLNFNDAPPPPNSNC